ncbi:MAG: hypothetical protein DME10_04120 [Candidatus Rokuibacteriota bacterium]|nr:MAG: hypothetical protein DME10_04120 [Candidatus Rokubacteria bacterium]
MPVTRFDHGQHGDRLEIVRGDGDLAILCPDPALAREEARHALPLGHVLRVVPVVELVLGRLPDVHRRDQRPFGHGLILLWRLRQLARWG